MRKGGYINVHIQPWAFGLAKKYSGGDTLLILDQPCLYPEIPCTRMQIVRAAQSGFAEFEVFFELDKALGSSGSGIDLV